jgi:hypothetical protein
MEGGTQGAQPAPAQEIAFESASYLTRCAIAAKNDSTKCGSEPCRIRSSLATSGSR